MTIHYSLTRLSDLDNIRSLDHLSGKTDYLINLPVITKNGDTTPFIAQLRIFNTGAESEESAVQIRILDSDYKTEILPWSWPERFYDLLETPYEFTLDHKSYVVPFDLPSND